MLQTKNGTRRMPTKKQRKALEYIMSGEADSIADARRKAGYSKWSVNKSDSFTKAKAVTEFFGDLKNAHQLAGNTPQELANDMFQMRQAIKKDGTPDWQARSKAHEIIRRDFGLWSNANKQEGDSKKKSGPNLTQNNTYILDDKTAENFADYLDKKLDGEE